MVSSNLNEKQEAPEVNPGASSLTFPKAELLNQLFDLGRKGG